MRSIHYNAAGQITASINKVGATIISANGTEQEPITHNAAGQRQTIPREDGTQWAYSYNARGEVTGGSKQLISGTGNGNGSGSGTALSGYQYTYQYDSIGNRTRANANGRAAAYSANALNQYTRRDVPGYVDILGSAHAEATVTVNNQRAQRQGGYFHKQLAADNSQAPVLLSATTIGVLKGAGPVASNGNKDVVSQVEGSIFLPKHPEAFTYDADGNLTQDGRWHYTWDAENRLISMESIAGVPDAAKKRLEFAYDFQCRRVQKRTFTWANGSYVLENTTRFVYDGWNVIAELNNVNAPMRTYLWGRDLSGNLQGAGGVGGLLAITTNSDTYTVSYGVNGNIIGLVDGSGQVVASYQYGPFGEPLHVNSSMAALNPFRFSTKYTDDETGLVYYGYRYYYPGTGRWINRDPIEEDGGENLYGMLRNKQVNRVDSLGLKTCCDIKGEKVPIDKTEEISLCFRKANLPGGKEVYALFGKAHVWTLTSWGELGMGIREGEIPGQNQTSIGLKEESKMIDHTGQSKQPDVICIKTTVKKCCFYEETFSGKPKGVWFPLYNDCNTTMAASVNRCGGDWNKVYAAYLKQNKEYQSSIKPSGVYFTPFLPGGYAPYSPYF